MHVCKELVPFIWTAHILRHGISPRWYVMSERKQNIFGLEKVASHPNFGLGQGKLLKGIVLSHLVCCGSICGPKDGESFR